MPATKEVLGHCNYSGRIYLNNFLIINKDDP